jgi:hypothetical protein
VTPRHYGAVWRRGSGCDPAVPNCVEVAKLPGAAAVRDSSAPDGPVLVYTRSVWIAFIDAVKRGEFDHD